MSLFHNEGGEKEVLGTQNMAKQSHRKDTFDLFHFYPIMGKAQ